MGQVLHGSATTTEAIRRAIQHSQESLRTLAKRYGINQKTVAKWKGRSTVTDLPTGPKEPRSTVLSVEEEAVIVAFRRYTLLLLDIGAEALAVDWSVEDARRREPIPAQRAEEGQCAPVAVRSQAAQPLAFRPPTAQRSHVGLDPGLIDEDQALGIEAALPGSPSLAPAGNVSARLLKGEQRFF
jgi:hypothetical protein